MGNRKWFSAALQTAGFPITPHYPCSILGLITGIDDFFYSFGVSYLPVPTSSLIISTQLGFTAVFAFLIVGHKFTAESINSVIILTFGAVVLGVHANGTGQRGVEGKYYIGFVMTLVAAVLYRIVLPLVELFYAKAKQEITYALVMEIQLILGFNGSNE
ncbi:hypothetical protein HPP92_020825 [Vanilla planifolia]|uniref:Uncharacterized protein n=1 Tax=Vanilla planifolia TaxID=51239 RepID=A0A835PYS1_VANPL|nr:hypothetical protein HPP92_020825 [Vanilla planifolia]